MSGKSEDKELQRSNRCIKVYIAIRALLCGLSNFIDHITKTITTKKKQPNNE